MRKHLLSLRQEDQRVMARQHLLRQDISRIKRGRPFRTSSLGVVKIKAGMRGMLSTVETKEKAKRGIIHQTVLIQRNALFLGPIRRSPRDLRMKLDITQMDYSPSRMKRPLDPRMQLFSTRVFQTSMYVVFPSNHYNELMNSIIAKKMTQVVGYKAGLSSK